MEYKLHDGRELGWGNGWALELAFYGNVDKFYVSKFIGCKFGS